MRKASLLYKLIITFTIILGVVLISLALILSIWFKGNYFAQKRVQFKQSGQYICEVARLYEIENSEISLEKLQTIVDLSSVVIDGDIFIESNTGYAYIESQRKDNNISSKINIPKKYMGRLKNGETVELIDDQYTLLYPIIEDQKFNGVIVMTTALSIINVQLHKIYIIIWISALFAMIFASVVLSLFAKKILINPLAEINNAAKRFANGEVHKRVYIESRDEIGQLANSFNIMAESLEKVENNRRDFISNVSHELRSPITSIKGFIAGIIDGIIPKDKEGYYLDRVYSEIKRLTRLINDLLDLSTIESGKLKFDIKKFDINELLRLCVINNERKIKEKGITLKVMLQGKKCYVDADEDKIIQVITNLLDNAIKYCGTNGNIKISTYTKGIKVFVKIYNDGPKITDDEIRHIWDRFYKSDKSRTNKVSTGLGLPIVRMILVQQNEEIWVKNDKVRGVSFVFSLTRHK